MSMTTKLIDMLSMHGASASQRIKFYCVMAFLLVLSAGVAKASSARDYSAPVINESSSVNQTSTITSSTKEDISPIESLSASSTTESNPNIEVTINGESYPVPASGDMHETIKNEDSTTHIDVDRPSSDGTAAEENNSNLELRVSVSSESEAESEVNNRIRIRTRVRD